MSCKDEIYQSSSSTTKDGKPEKPEDKAEKEEWINVVRETRKELSKQISLSSLRNNATLKQYGYLKQYIYMIIYPLNITQNSIFLIR